LRGSIERHFHRPQYPERSQEGNRFPRKTQKS
jgi:hypothetical protein